MCETRSSGNVVTPVWSQNSAIRVSGPKFHDEELADPRDEEPRSYPYEQVVNAYFVHAGIGWQLLDGRIVSRGAEAFEAAVSDSASALAATKRHTAARHVHDDRQALSRRPEPDLSGAIYHAMGALEAVARGLAGNENASLGEILKRHPQLLPPPLDKALSQVWGYSSSVARHVVEGQDPQREEAELVVGLASTVATYLSKRGRHEQ